MAFDVQGARQAGYSDAEIADQMAADANFDAAGARKSGYSDQELISHLGAPPAVTVGSGSTLGDVITSPDANAADVPSQTPTPDFSLTAVRDKMQQGEASVLDRLRPGPNAGVPEQVLRTAGAVGVHGLSTLLQMPVNALIGLGQGPSGAVTINPQTNTLGLTPEATTAATTFGGVPLRFSGANPLMREPVSPVTLTKPPPVSLDELKLAIQRSDQPPPPAPRPPGESQASIDASGGYRDAAPGSLPASTSGGARQVADAYYNTFDQAAKDGGSLTPNVANKVIATVESRLPSPGMGEAFAGDELRGIVAKLQQYKDKPMTLQDVQAVDQRIGDLIHNENDPIKGMSPFGRQLEGIQDDIRDLTEHPAPQDVVGGQDGLDALSPARQAYSQSKKLEAVERMWDKAQGTKNPTTAYATAVNNFLANKRRSAGFSDDEKSAVVDSAKTGVVGGAVHLLGSRLIPTMAAAVEAGSHGMLAGSGAFLTTYLGGSAARALENRAAASRYGSARSVLGASVPDMPILQNPLGPGADIPTITVRPRPQSP